ncbi:YrhB domain-containing protein [Streptomyces sp. PTD5-9]|uniref:YrhB domain-containing protein n=1 Tax=Streptomyces sp. PTD5-9 TaxID=3120150 RepID=UPI00300B4D2F
MRMAVAHVEQHELVWIVSWTSEEYLRTRNPRFGLAGNGPYLVDRLDGSLHVIGVVSAASGKRQAASGERRVASGKGRVGGGLPSPYPRAGHTDRCGRSA